MEPAYAMLSLIGSKVKYPKDEIRYSWKTLIKNHPHDSICCCSRNEVMRHMQDRFAIVDEVTEMLLKRAIAGITDHVDLFEVRRDNYLISLTNTTEIARDNEIVEATIDLLGKDKDKKFSLISPSGENISYEILSSMKTKRDVFTPINLPGVLEIRQCRIRFIAQRVESYSAIGLVIKPNSSGIILKSAEQTDSSAMENENYKITISKNGCVNILNKDTGKEIQDAIDFEDTADCGDSYIYGKTDDKSIYASSFKATVTCTENTSYVQQYRISRTMSIPCEYLHQSKMRSADVTPCATHLIITLQKNSRVIGLAYELDNTAKDHRVRVVIKTGISSENSLADIPFDIVSHDDSFHFQNTMSKTLPNTSFAVLDNGERGFAVFTKGQHEYEHIQMQSALAFTILRSTGVIGRDFSTLESTGGEQWLCSDNQCLYSINGEIGLMVFEGSFLENEVPRIAKKFRNPLLVGFNSCDRNRFAGGRAAVQDSRVAELFYRDDKDNGLKIDRNSILYIDNSIIQVTSVKQAERNNRIIIRMWNASEIEQTARVTINGLVRKVRMNEETERKLGIGEFFYTFGKKEILTISVDRNGM